MTFKELQNRVSNGENLFTEFKHKINFPEKIAAEIVAFANTKGGLLLIGVDDNKVISGIKNIEEEIYELDKLLLKLIKNSIDYSKEIIPISDKKSVLAVRIKESVVKPNSVVSLTGQKTEIVYVRSADRSVQASNLVIKIMQLQSQNTQVRLKFGDIEKNIMQIVENQGFTTIKSIINLSHISEKTAQESCINLVLSGILKIVPEEGKEDKFIVVEQ